MIEFVTFKHWYSWNEWVTIPMRYCDLARNVQLCLTLYEYRGPGKTIPVGGTTLPLFGKLGVYRQVIPRDDIIQVNVDVNGIVF